MKNWEYWEKELRVIGNFDFAVVDGVVKSCSGTCCDTCKFKYACNCNDGRLTWLYSDNEPTLTQKEKVFVDMLNYGYIARDENGYLYLYEAKPHKDYKEYTGSEYIKIDENYFKFIQWESEPWSIEDLKKLKVKE